MTAFNLKYVADRRKMLGLSYQQMADLMGFKTHTNYMRYEKGEYTFDVDMLPRLATALRCDVKNFFTKQSSKTEQAT